MKIIFKREGISVATVAMDHIPRVGEEVILDECGSNKVMAVEYFIYDGYIKITIEEIKI